MDNVNTVSPIEVSRQLMAVLASCSTTEVDYLLSSDTSMEIRLGSNHCTYRTSPQIREGLAVQTSNWPEKPFLNVQRWSNNDTSVTVQFDIWDRPNGRVVYSNYALDITLYQNKIKTINLYQGAFAD